MTRAVYTFAPLRVNRFSIEPLGDDVNMHTVLFALSPTSAGSCFNSLQLNLHALAPVVFMNFFFECM
jgi:hypothetical protein